MQISYGPKIDYKRCIGCGLCYELCPVDVFGWDEEKDLPIVAYPKECYQCGSCELECPQMAIDVTLPPWLQLGWAKKVK